MFFSKLLSITRYVFQVVRVGDACPSKYEFIQRIEQASYPVQAVKNEHKSIASRESGRGDDPFKYEFIQQ